MLLTAKMFGIGKTLVMGKMVARGKIFVIGKMLVMGKMQTIAILGEWFLKIMNEFRELSE
jgi:hypothetical protein